MITDREILKHIEQGTTGTLLDACRLMEMRRQGQTEISQGFSVGNPPASEQYYQDTDKVDDLIRLRDRVKEHLFQSFRQLITQETFKKQESPNASNTN
jgi:hypothetical protein